MRRGRREKRGTWAHRESLGAGGKGARWRDYLMVRCAAGVIRCHAGPLCPKVKTPEPAFGLVSSSVIGHSFAPSRGYKTKTILPVAREPLPVA